MIISKTVMLIERIKNKLEALAESIAIDQAKHFSETLSYE